MEMQLSLLQAENEGNKTRAEEADKLAQSVESLQMEVKKLKKAEEAAGQMEMQLTLIQAENEGNKTRAEEADKLAETVSLLQEGLKRQKSESYVEKTALES